MELQYKCVALLLGYTRIAGSARPGFAAVLGTFVVSAIWHGIAPGYYSVYIFHCR